MNKPVIREAIDERIDAWIDRQVLNLILRQIDGLLTQAEVDWWEKEIAREAYRIKVCAYEAAGITIKPEPVPAIVAIEAA